MFSIFKTFFALGWVSFGGPAAHIGYFRHTFVEKLGWLTDEEYGQIVALSQFLPGPGSSQVGFALGYTRGGLLGGCMAFLGFTLPSILLMMVLAYVSSTIMDNSLFQQVVHGLKLLAVVVVADATLGMYRNFCKTRLAVGLCVATACALLMLHSVTTQIVVLIVAALVGVKYLRQDNLTASAPFKPSIWPLALFAILLFGLPFVASLAPSLALFDHFYQAGSLVFGGGHVVLPLLQNLIGGELSQDTFLTGYAAAQAVPGPMFTFATFLGWELMPQSPVFGAIVATIAVFLPGFLLLLGVLKNWQSLAQKPAISGAVNGVNAAVVGLLISALYQPVFTSAVTAPYDLAAVLVGLYLLKQWKLPIVWMVLLFMLVGIVLGFVY
ncbi:chromate efflux transporter [Vibrio sp. SM6]|uniref:Chromate efflux transporter n=1 Tax=Vibrio agarilyticus TaxID=2726741 RepID=A0A7X8TPW7_9VIBR|nr:chromate efflux transporter [Vibrio agarilyticus]NLS12693.1 chromate efflux transporter [Vibrio agarilyticus]